MHEYTYSEARQRLADLLDQAQREGSVRIRRRDGTIFIIALAQQARSPLDVPGIDVPLTRDEIVELIHDGRRTL